MAPNGRAYTAKKDDVAEKESTGPNQWTVAVNAQIPDDHWEYQMRKAANDGKGDAAFNGLDYTPVCTHMPVCAGKCETPTFMWKKKAR